MMTMRIKLLLLLLITVIHNLYNLVRKNYITKGAWSNVIHVCFYTSPQEMSKM
jgi:hypothetical protein